MWIAIKTRILPLWSIVFLILPATAQVRDLPPTADEILAKMIQLNADRQAAFRGYVANRRYVAVNRQRTAEMVVRVSCAADGLQQLTIVSEKGSPLIRKYVFYKMLEEETEASRPEAFSSTRITPANYNFHLLGQDLTDGRPAYVFQITPKRESKYVIQGKIWVDASDYSIVRIEGRPERNPSFWIRSLHFVRRYQKLGLFWLPDSTNWVVQNRFFGIAELTVKNSDYVLNPPNLDTRAQKPGERQK